ncbi:Fic family protein [Fusobacterium varium]|uniref:Fic family protein n=1 Tax=Fusobacterium varium TaxID=856 RepID=UPI0022E9745C|nr:Fic family protein [Fusobacterium varium]
MRIVKLSEEFLDYIKSKNSKFHEAGIGLLIYDREDLIFIPITSNARYKEKFLSDPRYPFFKIANKRDYGTLLIVDYLYINYSLYHDLIKVDKRVEEEIAIFKENENEIIKKLKLRKNIYINSYDKKVRGWLENYLNDNVIKNRGLARKYAQKLIQSMSVLEKISFSEEEIEEVIQGKYMEKVDTYEVRTVINLSDAWEQIMETLEKPLTIDYIVHINKIIAKHQALKVGDIRDGNTFVSGEFEIQTPNKGVIKRFTERLNKMLMEAPIIEKEKVAITIFYNIILNQWFYDGNKRTAFAIMNKILIGHGIGVMLILPDNLDKFSNLLYNCYKYGDKKNKDIFFEFLRCSCFIKF